MRAGLLLPSSVEPGTNACCRSELQGTIQMPDAGGLLLDARVEAGAGALAKFRPESRRRLARAAAPVSRALLYARSMVVMRRNSTAA